MLTNVFVRLYTLSKSFTIPSALLTTLAKAFHTKLLATAFVFTKLSTKSLLLWRCRVSFEHQWLLQNIPASFYLVLVNVQASSFIVNGITEI